jgi:hypothetical protein
LTAIADTLSFLHCALFSPPISTLIATVKNNLLITSLGLSTKKHQKYLAPSTAIAKGHLDKQRQNSKSTQFKCSIPTESHYKLEFPKMTGIRTNKVYASLVKIVKTSGTIFTDVTRKLPIASNCRNKYIFTLYGCNSNDIHAEPLKSCFGPEIIQAYSTIPARLIKAIIKSKLRRLDKKSSCTLQEFIRKAEINFHLAPPHMHHRHTAKRKIHKKNEIKKTDPKSNP